MVEHLFEICLGISAWYLTSFGTLLLNKYLLEFRHVEPNTLALVQMVSTAIYGGLKNISISGILREVRAWRKVRNGVAACENLDPEDPHSSTHAEKAACSERHQDRWRRALMQMSLVGGMRFATVVLGLVSLKHVAASFTETIKASAPFFTVVIAYLMLGERTPLPVCVTLVPVASGLVLVSSNELSFNLIGFSAAVLTNVIECVQNVFSKRLLAGEYTASQLQFYTSLTALLLQGPILIVNNLARGTTESAWDALHDNSTLAQDEFPLHVASGLLPLLWIDGVLYHAQSVVAYVVMSYLSPVTVSVVNTLKRALLIWISVIIFRNDVTHLARLGTGLCLGGALWYNYLVNYLKQSGSVSSAMLGLDIRKFFGLAKVGRSDL
mmetsp:Transcript_43194/g.99582  ORF Transcript_43194/g.99582 Transcript_43194/m.99582 type:complete len:382 (+) Transcript_43194:141-1286(+)